jgi:hypothetical protein
MAGYTVSAIGPTPSRLEVGMVAKTVNRDGQTILVIEIPMTEPRESAAGKTFVVASTHGFLATTVVVDKKPVAVSLNAVIRK